MPDQDDTALCHLGYEFMKMFVAPQVFMWVAPDWHRCHLVQAERVDDDGEAAIGLRLTSYRTGTLIPDYSPN